MDSRVGLMSVAILVCLGTAWLRAAIVTEHVVTNTLDSGDGSLRQAIIDAANDGTDSLISFNIPNNLFPTIQPLTGLALPPNTTIDGTTQPTSHRIGLRGAQAPADSIGLRIVAGGCAVRGLSIRVWSGGGILIANGGGNVITECDIGEMLAPAIQIQDSSGNVIGGPGMGNFLSDSTFGVSITGSGSTGNRIEGNAIQYNDVGILCGPLANFNMIGGTTNGSGNGIALNRQEGILLNGSSGNTVRGNYIGTSGDQAASNHIGIHIIEATLNEIGGDTEAARNVISGNSIAPELGTPAGVVIEGLEAKSNRVRGNYIGTDSDGSLAVPNTVGVRVTQGASNNRIGGDLPGQGNVISGNTEQGVLIEGPGNFVQGNVIGLDSFGFSPVPNVTGVLVMNGDGNVIGGSNPRLAVPPGTELGGGNIVTGNYLAGISLRTDDNVVAGNIIGLAADGVTPMGNGDGVILFNSSRNQIGRPPESDSNVISGNTFNGVSIFGIDSTDNRVHGNVIGLDVSREQVIGNSGRGVSVFGSFNHIGEQDPLLANVIAGNLDAGVSVAEAGNNNLVGVNAIFSNRGLGIDLAPAGVTPNDAGDLDSGANLLQNFPVVTGAFVQEQPPRFTGTLNSQPQTGYTVNLYLNESADPSGFGEGQHFLMSFDVLTDAEGNVSWEQTFPGVLPPGRFVAATATGPATNTSEFSLVRVVEGGEPTADEIALALVGLLEVRPEYNVNGDMVFDAADLVKAVNGP